MTIAETGAPERRDTRVRALATGIAILIPFAFLALGILRAYPFVDDVRLPAVRGDDWHTYKRLAVSVLQGGLSMPGVSASYTGLPHGFLYIYFLALVFALSAVNSTYVYVVQSAIAGLSVSLTYVAVRRRLTARGGLAFLVALTGLVYVDVFRHLCFKLLSENLYFLLAPPAFILLFRAFERRGHATLDPFFAGLLLGLVVLARPSFVGSTAAVLVVLAVAAAMRQIAFRTIAAVALGAAVAASTVAIRNYAAAGHASFDLVTDTFDWLKLWDLPLRQALSLLATRTMFVLGYTHALAPAYRVRPYWTALWVLWAAFPFVGLRRGRRLDLSDCVMYAFVVGYIVPVLLVAADLGSYGGRMVIVVLPLLLIAPFRMFCGVDRGSPEPVPGHGAAHVWH